jgi:hypothetical protein
LKVQHKSRRYYNLMIYDNNNNTITKANTANNI